MFNWFKKTSYHKWKGSWGGLDGINDIIEYIFQCEKCKEVRKVLNKTDLTTINSRRGCYG